MIKLRRPKPPKHFNKSQVLKETKDAIRLFAPTVVVTPAIEQDRKDFKYKQYGKGDVKDVLKKMSHNKCAYCESTLLHVYYGDIEHFRPKKYVGTPSDNVKPGYYWLSNDWHNLFLSCLFCNQAKKQIVQAGKSSITIGKQNQFPLSKAALYKTPRDHSTWETTGKRKDDNARLIVNPCKDKPEEYFAYDDDGVIKPKETKVSRKTHKRAEASIDVYALQRLYLVQERKKRLIVLKMQFEQIRKLLLASFAPKPSAAIQPPMPGVAVLMQNNTFNQLSDEIEILFHFTFKRQIFAGMCRQYVYEFIRKEIFDTPGGDKEIDKKIKKIESSVHKQLDEKFELSGEI